MRNAYVYVYNIPLSQCKIYIITIIYNVYIKLYNICIYRTIIYNLYNYIIICFKMTHYMMIYTYTIIHNIDIYVYMYEHYIFL